RSTPGGPGGLGARRGGAPARGPAGARPPAPRAPALPPGADQREPPVDPPPPPTRPSRPADIDALYQICLLTGDAGQDATSRYHDPKLLGHCVAAPYGLFEPSLAFVAEDTSGVAGYIVGALDSQAFEKRLESDWWPRLRTRYPEPPPGLRAQRWTPDQSLAHIIHHPLRTPDELAARYPSHLHINLLPRLQARGYGRQLIQTLTAALRDQ